MLNLLNYDRPLMVNGRKFNNSAEALEAFKDFKGPVQIHFSPKIDQKVEPVKPPAASFPTKTIYRIKVRQYMTKKSTPDFDFMAKYNNDVPMPFRVMYGEILQETPGMYKMSLHGRAERDAVQCCRCGRQLTHPVSRVYGIGPECGEHGWQSNEWIDALIGNEEALFREADKRLRAVTWTGWIPKKAIESMMDFKEKEEATA